MSSRDSQISVVLVDDHDLFRSGLAAMLQQEPGIGVVGQASGGRRGLRLVHELQPQVVLMDLRMPDLDGIAATREILGGDPECRVLILSAVSEQGDVEAAVLAGVCGFLLKDAPVSDVASAIHAAAAGHAWLGPRAAAAVLECMRRGPVDPSPTLPADLLSGREQEVLALVARGYDNAQIAQELCISPATVKNHLSNVLTKLEISNRVQAAIYAVRHGLG